MAVRLALKGEKIDNAKPWILSLESHSTGEVSVVAKSPDGADAWLLLKIKPDGTFYRETDIGDDSGFKLTVKGQLVESKEE